MVKRLIVGMLFIFSLTAESTGVSTILEQSDDTTQHLQSAIFHLDRLTEGDGACGYHYKQFLYEFGMAGYTLERFDATSVGLRLHLTTCVERTITYHLAGTALSTKPPLTHLWHIENELAEANLSSADIDIDIGTVLSIIILGLHFRYR